MHFIMAHASAILSFIISVLVINFAVGSLCLNAKECIDNDGIIDD
jgi:hypothetical protein